MDLKELLVALELLLVIENVFCTRFLIDAEDFAEQQRNRIRVNRAFQQHPLEKRAVVPDPDPDPEGGDSDKASHLKKRFVLPFPFQMKPSEGGVEAAAIEENVEEDAGEPGEAEVEFRKKRSDFRGVNVHSIESRQANYVNPLHLSSPDDDSLRNKREVSISSPADPLFQLLQRDGIHHRNWRDFTNKVAAV